METEIKIVEGRCETCNSGLGSLKMNTPLYCIPCIEEMDKLNMSPKRYGKHRGLLGISAKKEGALNP